MNTSEARNPSASILTNGTAPSGEGLCPRRCHLCPHSYSRRVRHGAATYYLGQRCLLYGDVPLDAVGWRREQNRAYDEATRCLDAAPLPCRLAPPQDDDGQEWTPARQDAHPP